jgi:hypothetical protein
MKDLDRSKFLFIAYALLQIVGLVVVIRLAPHQFYWAVSAPLLLFMVVTVAAVHERNEDRYKGYIFMRVMPLTLSEIVIGKFILMLLVTIAAAGFIFMLAVFIPMTSDLRALGAGIILFAANLSLLVAALMYLGIYALGYIRFSYVARISLLVFILIPQLVFFFAFKSGNRPDFKNLLCIFTQANWLVISLCCVVFYFLLMLAAVKVRRDD